MINLASILLLIGAAQGIFFSLVLLGLPKGKRTANFWLSMFLFGFSIGMIGTVLYDQRIILEYPNLALIHTVLAPFNGIGLYLYIQSLSSANDQFKGWQWLHLAPILVSVVLLMPFFILPVAQKKTLLEASYSGFPVWWRVNFAFAAIVNAVYIMVSLLKISRHERHIRRLYSNTAQKSLVWVSNFIYAGAGIFVICVILSFFDIARADTFSNLLFAFLIYIMGYRALRQPEIFTDLPIQTVAEADTPTLNITPAKYEKSGLTEGKARVMIAKLDELFAKEKIYLQPDLTLQELADHLGETAHQVSQLLNQFKQQNFFDFVNTHRVEHFKEAIVNPNNAHLSILAIALDSGFNSKAAFNEVFKKNTGLTPSAFRQATIQAQSA